MAQTQVAAQAPGTQSTQPQEPVAILGVGCKLPGGIESPAGLVAALRNRRDCIVPVPSDRWLVDEFYDRDAVVPGKTYSRQGGFVSNIANFDAGFFGISNAEADRMDPQQRMLLETVWHALEHAGQNPDELAGTNTGMFLGMMNTNDYCHLKRLHEGERGINAFDAVGDVISITAGRISHFLGLEGPCLAVDTACSASLVAVHLACQSIQLGECDAAIVAGVSAVIQPAVNIAFSKVGLLSRDERCKSFDASADGYVRGEGCVAVFLRRQSSALARRDRILATIVGSAINQDGRTPALTAPNGMAQQKVLGLALARAGVDPRQIRYVEAHGTGTAVGDPLEMNSLLNVYGAGRAAAETLYVGSIKSNVGHTEATAGVLGLAKAALSLSERQIFPNLHFTRMNPAIDLHGVPIRVPTTTLAWPRTGRLRYAAVNSFGYSGTNAHAVLQETPEPAYEDASQEPAQARPCELIPISAKSRHSLDALVDAWCVFLEQDDAELLPSIANSAARGRAALNHRLAVRGRSRAEIAQKLRAWRDGRDVKGVAFGRARLRGMPKLAFVFTGQGSQYAGMGRQLYECEPYFKQALDRCARTLDALLGVGLCELLFGASTALLDDTRYAQPAIFALDYALAVWFAHCGVHADVVLGHSVGEFVAACVAGMIDLDDALTLVATRGRLMGALPRDGKMVALAATPEEAEAFLAGEPDAALAAVNGPHAVVISGRSAAVDAVTERAKALGRRVKELSVSHAFHSALVEPMLAELSAAASGIQLREPTRMLISTLSGEPLTRASLPADYFARHARETVQFQRGMAKALEAGCSLFVEIGPQSALVSALAADLDRKGLVVSGSLQRDGEDVDNMLDALGTLFAHGMPVQLGNLFDAQAPRCADLPLYPFRPDHHWFKLGAIARPSVNLPADEPLLGQRANAVATTARFETQLSTTLPWVDHRVHDHVVLPAAAYIESVARGVAQLAGQTFSPAVLHDVEFERALLLAYGKPKLVRLSLDGLQAGQLGAHTRFAISSLGDEGELRHCTGGLAAVSGAASAASSGTTLAQLAGGPLQGFDVAQYYTELRQHGLDHGASFATLRQLWSGAAGSGEAWGRVALSHAAAGDAEVSDAHPFRLSVLLDGCFHVLAAAVRTHEADSGSRGAFVPRRIASLTLWRALPASVLSHVTVAPADDPRAVRARVRVTSEAGEPLIDIDGLELYELTGSKAAAARPAPAARTTSRRADSREELLNALRKLPRRADRVAHMSSWLLIEVKDALGQAGDEWGIDLDNLDPSLALVEVGMDSLLVTELQRRLQEKLEFRFPPMQGLDNESIDSLSAQLLDLILPETQPNASASEGATLHAGE
jgi:acyl transferase domain-containing protein